MIVRDNPGSRRTVRYLGQANSKVSKELEKLSSGYKINRAADDAAGLAVSEKMRTQITGLSRAKLNSQEGCSLIQTGEGALEEVHDMLNRASELADRSANGTYEDELDRENLQKELDNLCQEIDRISAGANFNGIKLFQDDGLEYERSPGKPTYPSADPVQPVPGSRSFSDRIGPVCISSDRATPSRAVPDGAGEQCKSGLSYRIYRIRRRVYHADARRQQYLGDGYDCPGKWRR